MSSYSTTYSARGYLDEDLKPRAFSREELQQFSFKRANPGYGTTQNSYSTQVLSSRPINSVVRGYGGFENSVQRTHRLGGAAYDPGNSSDRLRWEGYGSLYDGPPALSKAGEEEILSKTTAPFTGLFTKYARTAEWLGKRFEEPDGFGSGGSEDEDEDEDGDDDDDTVVNGEKKDAESADADGGEEQVPDFKKKDVAKPSTDGENDDKDGGTDEKDGSEAESEKEDEDEEDYNKASAEWLQEVPEQYRAQLETVWNSFRPPSEDEQAKIALNSDWVMWRYMELYGEHGNLFIRSQKGAEVDVNTLDWSVREGLEDLRENMLHVQRRAVAFLDQYHDHLAKGMADEGWMSRAAVRGLAEVKEQEDLLEKPGPRILSPEMREFMLELAALDPFLGELKAYNVHNIVSEGETVEDNGAEEHGGKAVPSEEGNKGSTSHKHRRTHTHICDICRLKEPVRHYNCKDHEGGGYDICAGCYAAGHIRCPDDTHTPPMWLGRCKDDDYVAKELSPREARTAQLWVRILDRYRDDLEQDEGWEISEDEGCLVKFIEHETNTIGTSTDPTMHEPLQKQFKKLLHFQSEARRIVLEGIANHEMYDFDTEAYGRAAHRLLLRIFALESDLREPGPCVVADLTRHSLISIASWDEDASAYWAQLLGTEWYADEGVEMYAEEYQEEPEDDSDDDFDGDCKEGPLQRAPRCRH